MSRPESLLHPERLTGALVKIGLAWLYGLALGQLVLHLNRLPLDPVRQGLAALILLLLLALLTWQRYSLLVLSAMILFGTFAAWQSQDEWIDSAVSLAGRLQNWLNWAYGWLNGQQPAGSDQNQQILALLICLLLALAGYLFLARFNWPFLALAILFTVTGLNYNLPRRELYPWVMAAGLTVVAAFAREQRRTYRHLAWRRHPAQSHFQLQVLPMAILSLVLAIGLSSLLPPTAFYSTTLLNLTDYLWGRISTISVGRPAFPEFSIAAAGYYPLIDRLGGPVQLSDQPVLQVDGYAQPLLLRGAISRTYDGKSWRQDRGGQILRFDNPFWEQERNLVFDLEMPDPDRILADPIQIMANIRYRVAPVNLPFQTVFLAGRPISISSGVANRILFYDTAGQMYSSDWQLPEQALTVDSRILLTEKPDFAQLAATMPGNLTPGEKERLTTIRGRYLQMPGLAEYAPEGELDLLADAIIGQEKRPWQQAQLIRSYLQLNCQYNLQVSVPPADVDFVSWFLQTKEGYCVYFATAMTMLCRLADIPARYVEGYFAPESLLPDGFRIVTGKLAHAWTEIFLAGIGWVPIDATPGGSGVLPGATPTPDPAVTLTPTPDPLAPSPTAAAVLSPEPTDVPGNQPDQAFPWPSPWWLMILLILPLAYAGYSIWWFKRRHDRAWLRRHYNDDRRLGVYYWQEILDILQILGFHRHSWETPRQLIKRVIAETHWLDGRNPAAARMLEGTEKALFSSHLPSDEDLVILADLADILEQTLLQNRSRLLFVLQRICYHRQK